MGCGCKKNKKLTKENTNPTIRKRKQEEIMKLRESLRNQLKNFHRLSK
jgi:hypothetical protein